VERRIEVIKRRRDIALIERPECKRRWSMEPWEKKERAALRSWLLDRCETVTSGSRSMTPAPSSRGRLTVNRLADRLRDDSEFVSVGRLYAGQDAELAAVIAEITDAEHVPYLAALRYKDTGLRKRRQWEETWDLQRQEDATGKRLCSEHPGAAESTLRRLPQGLVLVRTAASWTYQRSGSSPIRRRAPTVTGRCCSAGPAGITGSRRTP